MTSGKSARRQRLAQRRLERENPIEGISHDWVIYDEFSRMPQMTPEEYRRYRAEENYRQKEKELERLKFGYFNVSPAQLRALMGGETSFKQTRPNGSTVRSIPAPAPNFSIHCIGGHFHGRTLIKERKNHPEIKDGHNFSLMLPGKLRPYGEPDSPEYDAKHVTYRAVFIPESETEHIFDHDFAVVIAILVP